MRRLRLGVRGGARGSDDDDDDDSDSRVRVCPLRRAASGEATAAAGVWVAGGVVGGVKSGEPQEYWGS
jgi:hypothetical protein